MPCAQRAACKMQQAECRPDATCSATLQHDAPVDQEQNVAQLVARKLCHVEHEVREHRDGVGLGRGIWGVCNAEKERLGSGAAEYTQFRFERVHGRLHSLQTGRDEFTRFVLDARRSDTVKLGIDLRQVADRVAVQL